ncbi:hypothetical protein [Anatilimnocola floriformis]|uniref:hypothetical protein n=1 Tax=Anatilimnocola floriformis TaxID=2948575 RepID=UPI0020C2A2F5|nr:hypothetical protein [Anatilimnocola floriformis]
MNRVDDKALDRVLLLAMKARTAQSNKCDVILRAALKALGRYDSERSELALCNGGYEDVEVGRAYDALRQLVNRGLAEGRGDLKSPAGPRYTECEINSAGLRSLGDD